MMCLIALLIKDEFPDADMDKVMNMCIIHDLGEAFTGDIPTFEKTSDNEVTEDNLLKNWINSFPAGQSEEILELFNEMNERKTEEAKIYKAIDSLEALIQHNISDISTWIPLEYDLNMHYADDKVAFSDYLSALREEIRKDTIAKINNC